MVVAHAHLSQQAADAGGLEEIVVTGKARARIRRFIRTQQRSQFVTLGRSMLQKLFQKEGYEFADKAVDNVLRSFKCQTVDDLYALIGEGQLAERQVLGSIFPGMKVEQVKAAPPLGKTPC